MAVLPEMFALCEEASYTKIQEPYRNGPLQEALSQMAKAYELWLVGGTLPLRSDNPQRPRASCLVFDPNGKEHARYDKIHLLDADLENNESYRESELEE